MRVLLLWGRHLLDLLLRCGLLLLVVLCGCWWWWRLLLGLGLYLGCVVVVHVGLLALLSPKEENDCEYDGTEEDDASNYSACNGPDWRALLLLLVGLGA